MKPAELFRIFERNGWTCRDNGGSHKVMQKAGFQNVILSYHKGDEVWKGALRKLAKQTGIKELCK